MKQRIALFCIILLIISNASVAQAPPMLWSKVFTGADYTLITDLVVDHQQNVVAVGRFKGTIDLQNGAATISYTSNGDNDIFIVSLDSAGNYLWSDSYGGTGVDNPFSIHIDVNNNIIINGEYQSFIDFHPAIGSATLSSNSISSFILKLNANGTLIWVKQVSSSSSSNAWSKGRGVISDSQGNIYSCGLFEGDQDFDPGSGVFTMSSTLMTNQSGNGYIDFTDYYIQKLDANGNFKWAVSGEGTNPYSTGTTIRHGWSLTLDENENIYLIGDFWVSCDFMPGSGSYNVISQGKSDAFVLKLDSVGDFQWVKIFAGNDYNIGRVIESGNKGDVYIAIIFSDTIDLDPGVNTQIKVSYGTNDIAILKLDTFGSLIWANQFGSSHMDWVSDMKIDQFGYLFATVYFAGIVDFDPGPSVVNLTTNSVNNQDFGILKLNSNGGLEWCDNLDSQPGRMEAHGIDVSNSGEIYYGGYYIYTVDLDMGTSQDIHTAPSPQFYDAPLVKLIDCLPSTDTQNILTCDTLLSPSGNFIWDSSGVYFDTLINATGCDSLLTIYLSFDMVDSQTVVGCDSFYFPNSGSTWDTSGIFLDTLLSVSGCDSIIRYGLTINYSYFDTIDIIACDSFVSLSGQNTWFISGIFTETFTRTTGCDSNISINLTVNHSSFDTISIIGCGEITSPSGRYIWTSSGTYQDTLVNQQLCDSVIQIYLTVYPEFDSSFTVTSCKPFTFLGTVYTTTGTFYDTATTQHGCDSTFLINYRNELPHIAVDLEDCLVVFYNGEPYYQSTSFSDTVFYPLECDTIYNIKITIYEEPLLLSFPRDTFMYKGQTFDIIVKSNIPIHGDWNNGLYLNCNNCTDNYSIAEDSIEYQFTFSDYQNCFVKDSSFILKVITIPETYIPNAFTPGNDGLNDVFEIKNPGVKTVSMFIYDRWGKLVFESFKVNRGWDGYIDGKRPSANAYFSYRVILELLDGSQEEYVGSVLLISK